MPLQRPSRSAGTRTAAPCVRQPRQAKLVLVAGLIVCALFAGSASAQGRGGGNGGPGGGNGGGMLGGGGRMGFAGDRGSAPLGARNGSSTGPHLSLPGRWWDDSKTSKRIGLRSDQQRRMDEIFDANKGSLLNLLGNLQREETHLTSMTPAELQDETKVFAAIDRVSTSRAELEKATAHTMMLIRQQMDTAQLTSLDREIATTR